MHFVKKLGVGKKLAFKKVQKTLIFCSSEKKTNFSQRFKCETNFTRTDIFSGFGRI